MISPEEFLDKWNSVTYGLVNYDDDTINLFSLNRETKEFLIKAGLPESAPPFLTFESSTSGGGIRLTEKNKDLGSIYNKFIYFGYTGNGYPVCINESNSEVVYIDYDNEDNSIIVNSTLAKFAECLLIYVEFIKLVKSVNGRRAYIEKNVTKDLLDWISSKLKHIDEATLIEGGFWEEELASFSE